MTGGSDGDAGPITKPAYVGELSISKPELKKLFATLGGEARLRTIVGDFYARMAADLMLGFFFQGKDLSVIAHRQGDFLLRAMGATPSYSGLPPGQAHGKLPPILAGHFDRRLRLLEDTLRDQGLDEESVRVWVAFEGAFRDMVQA